MKPILVAGWQKQSLIDYPGKVAAVIFLAGCNMRCHYCHNQSIWDPRQNQIPLGVVLADLRKHRALLEAVVVSGGEPTLHPHLPLILRKLRALGLSIKLDTNGTRPALVQSFIERRLVDFVAVDVKAPLAKYPQITGMTGEAVWQTVTLLKSQTAVPFQLRTTVTPRLTAKDLWKIGNTFVNGAPVWQIQQCRVVGAYPAQKVQKMAHFVEQFTQHIVVVGL